MEFGLSEQQRLMQDNLRRLLQETADLEDLRELIADGPIYDSTLWQGLLKAEVCRHRG